MAVSIELKWRNIKGWDSIPLDHPAASALQKWIDSDPGIGVMTRPTDEQKELICAVIDAVDGTIINDLTGEVMTPEEAKAYIMGE